MQQQENNHQVYEPVMMAFTIKLNIYDPLFHKKKFLNKFYCG
jgi:hypothetical protein